MLNGLGNQFDIDHPCLCLGSYFCNKMEVGLWRRGVDLFNLFCVSETFLLKVDGIVTVTGGSGKAGSAVIHVLLEHGYEPQHSWRKRKHLPLPYKHEMGTLGEYSTPNLSKVHDSHNILRL